jgi:hypothetical protein
VDQATASRRPPPLRDDRLLAVEIEDRAFVTAARRFGQTGARARREAFDALLAAAEEAIELRDDQTARTILGALAQSLDLGRDEAKIRVVINAAGIAWRSGARDEALAWRERLVANWRSVTARGQRSSLRRGLALFAAWEALRERQPARAALKPLKPHLVTSTLRRRLLTIRRRARLRALTVARDHHLVALEITFFDPDGIGLPQFLRLCRVLDSLWPDLSFDDRLEYLDTLWRIAEDDRCVELLRLASWLPERKLEALKSTLDRTKLLARSETFFDERREPVPAWIGHRYHRRWQAYWARRNEVFGYQDLLASLDKALEIFEKLGAEYVVARVLRDRGRASLDLAEERTDEQERYRNDAYLSFRRSAHVFRRLALGEMHVEALRAAVRVRIGLGTNAELRAAGRDIITDLEELLLAPSLPESEREPTGELLVLAAHVHGDTERVRKYMPKRESERLRDLEYAFARQRAEVALANGDDVSRVDAHRALMTCLHIIDDAHRQFAGAPGGGSLAGLDLPLEEAFVLARLTEVCFALGQHAEMLGDLGRLFELIARWRRVGPGPATDRLWDAVLPGGAKDPDTVVVSLFSRCVEVWHAPDQAVPVRERTPFFRRHLLQGLAGLPCVRRAFEILRRDYPVGASKAEELDLLLLEAEVGLREGAASAEVFDAALSALDAIDLDRETDVRYLAENMQRALRLMLEVRHDLSPLYVWFARVIEHRSHGRGGIEAIARSLAVALGYLSATYQSGDASGRAYYESFVTQAFTLLQEVRDELLTTTALESLVRADFLFREQRDKTLRWIRLWVALALNERDPRSFNSLVSLLCRVISAESGRRLNAPFIERLARMRQREAAQPAELSAATDLPVPPALPAAAEPPVPAEPAAAQTRPPVPSSSPEAEAQNNEAAMEICKRVIRECLAAPSWLAMQPRLTVLFDVVEKVVGDSRRDLRLVTGLALYRSSTSAVSSTLKLITDGWLDSATPQRQPTSDGPPPLAPADRWRVCWTLLLGELATLWPFDGRTGFVLHDVTPSWNLLVTLDRLERIQRSCAVVANASEIRIINGMVFALTQIARHWCFRLADRNLQAWGNFEALEPTSIGLVSLLAQRLDTPNRQRRNFFDAYSYLRALIDQWRLQRDQHFYDRETARAQGLTWIPSPDQSVSLLRRFQTIARRAVESMTNRVWSLKLDDLFSEVLDHLAGPPGTASTEAVYLEPEDVDMRGTLDEYDALVEEILIEGMSQHPVAPPTGPRVTLPPIIA